MKILLTLLIITSLHASDTLPKVVKPSVLTEGTERTLTESQIAEILPWAKDSKIFLEDLVSNIQTLAIDEKIIRLTSGIQEVVKESAPQYNETLLRYTLNRALIITAIIEQEMDMNAVGSKDLELRVLLNSITMAKKFYNDDLKNEAPLATFGMEYFKFLTEMNKSVIDASAQYSLYKTAIEFLEWDLYRDLENKKYATTIVKLHNALRSLPARFESDSKAIRDVRGLKKIALDIIPNNRQVPPSSTKTPPTPANTTPTPEVPTPVNDRTMKMCTTDSNGLNFNFESRDKAFSKVTVLQRCQANQRTNNRECELNLSCDNNQDLPPRRECMTSSRGLNFKYESRDVNFSKEIILRRCKENQSTNNRECELNLSCDNNRDLPPMRECMTSSRGLNFNYESRDVKFSREIVIQRCKANQSTNDRECEVNIFCEN